MKYFFSLFIMLFSLCGHLYASTNQHNISYTLEEAINHIDSDTHLEHYKFSENFFQATLEKENDLVFATDNEVADDEKVFSIKKDLTNSLYFSTVLYAEQIGCLCNNVKKRLPHSSLFVHFPTTKLNVLLGVYLI